MAEFGRTCISVPSDSTLHLQKQVVILAWTAQSYRARGNGSLPGFPDVLALNEKRFVHSRIKPQITKPRGGRKSLLNNSLHSAYKKPSPQAVDLRQGSE